MIIRFIAIALGLAISTQACAQWSISKDTDPISDAGSVTLSARSGDNGLAFMCKAGENDNPSVALMSTTYLGGRPTLRALIWRFDASKPVSENWAYSDHYVFRQGPSVDFISLASKSTKIAIRANDYKGRPLDAVIPLPGALKQLMEFRLACKKAGAGW